MTSTAREDVARVRDRLRDPKSSSAWNAEAADMLDDLLAERDAAQAEVERLREALQELVDNAQMHPLYLSRSLIKARAALTGEPRHDR